MPSRRGQNQKLGQLPHQGVLSRPQLGPPQLTVVLRPPQHQLVVPVVLRPPQELIHRAQSCASTRSVYPAVGRLLLCCPTSRWHVCSMNPPVLSSKVSSMTEEIYSSDDINCCSAVVAPSMQDLLLPHAWELGQQDQMTMPWMP